MEGMERIAGILEDKKIYFENHHDDIFCKIGGFYAEFHPQREYIFALKTTGLCNSW